MDKRSGGPIGSQQLITQGEYAVANRDDAVISTLLGSCVACCLWDENAKAGGMNHLLLAGERVGSGQGYDVAGVAEMELLINGIIKMGGRRERLQAKVFGGAQMLGGLSRGIGDMNSEFAFNYLKQEGIPCLNASVGGQQARALKFWPASGRVSMKLVSDAPQEAVVAPAPVAQGNDMELF